MDGWINLIKPAGVSSSFALQSLRRFFKNKKRVGHIGTLDPFASGVLPVAIGEATKAIEYLDNFQKTYIAEFAWGYETDTLDNTGEIIRHVDYKPNAGEVASLLPDLIGEIMQIPPKFSANKINGVRAYKLARQNHEFETTAKPVLCHALKMVAHDDENAVSTIEITCGRGFYIRSLARDIAANLGTVATVVNLRRVRDGIFFEKDGIKLDLLKKILHTDPVKLKQHLVPTANVLDDILVIAVNLEDAIRLKNGLQLQLPTGCAANYGQLVQIQHKGQLIAMCKVLEQMLKPIKVFNLFDWNQQN